MDGLLTLLLFAGLFYLLMRYGCGAHLIHGNHGGHSDSGKAIDPVCGMQVDPTQGYAMMHQGQAYRFCSRSCLDKFEDNPGQFLKPPQQGAGGSS